MFVIPTNVGFTHRVVAMLVACAVVLWSVGVYTTAQAANLLEVSNTLTDSGPEALSGHFFSFEIPTGSSVAAANDIVITFDPLFLNVTGVSDTDVTVRVDGGAPVNISANFAAGATTITFDGVTAAQNQVITVEIDPGIIENPLTVQSYEFLITVANATSDTGRTEIAIVDYVVVSAEVETSFIFTVSGTTTGVTVNATSTNGSSTATTIPFGVIDAGNIYTIAQELRVTTNAANGFTVTVEQDGNLRSATGADIDGFSNGTYVNTPVAWSAPTNSLLLENTWGHWGLTSNDSNNGTGADEFTSGGGNKWVAASTTPRAIFQHNDPADGLTQDYGYALVGYQVQITPLQEAGDDYTTTLMYIATPSF